ncbi:MAG: hypothetical protein AAGF20_09770, partial [Pseudomonadota bacterium]
TGLIATVGTAQQRIGDVKARNLGEEAALTISYNDLAARDQFVANHHVNERGVFVLYFPPFEV